MRRVRIWGGPHDGKVIEIVDAAETVYMLGPSEELEPVPQVVSYRVMNSPVGWVAVHPDIDAAPLP